MQHKLCNPIPEGMNLMILFSESKTHNATSVDCQTNDSHEPDLFSESDIQLNYEI